MTNQPETLLISPSYGSLLTAMHCFVVTLIWGCEKLAALQEKFPKVSILKHGIETKEICRNVGRDVKQVAAYWSAYELVFFLKATTAESFF